jgi:predicted permease
VRALFRSDQVYREIEAELQFHVEMRAEENIRRGMTPEEARSEAQKRFGPLGRIKEDGYDVRGGRWLETLSMDTRYAIRKLIKRPGFTLVAILTLGLGIGGNTAIFSVINTLMLRPLPIEKPGELVALNTTFEGHSFTTFSYPNYKDFRDRNQVFAGLMAYQFAPLSMSHEGINERLWGYLVTGNYFEVLGVKAALGRVISTGDDQTPGAHPVTVISSRCWRDRFGGEQSIIGKDVLVNGRSYTVIGVAPPGFNGTEVIVSPEMWFPIAMQAEIDVGSNWLNKRDAEYIFVQGRLKPTVSPVQAQAALNSIATQLETEYPNINAGERVALSAPGLLPGPLRGPAIGFTAVLMAAVGLVLLLACTNLANLLLARASERRREIAVRLALGASRRRLIGHLLTESVLLGVAGGVLGLVIASRLARIVSAIKLPIDVPVSFELHIDERVLVFTLTISLATGLLFGLLPALQATKLDLLSGLRGENSPGGFRRSWLGSSLIVSQVALSLLLLIGGGLMLRALGQAQTVDLGFNPQNAIETSFDLRLQGYDDAGGKAFQKRLLERVRAFPGVASAAVAETVPVDIHFPRAPIFVERQLPERPSNAPRALTNLVSPGYFQAMGTRLVEGRDFSQQDDENARRVAIVNETFAQRFWRGEDPIGKRFSIGTADSPKLQVVGVAQDGKYTGLNEDPKPVVYRPLLQNYSGATNLIVRTQTDPQTSISAVRWVLQQMDPQMPISSAKTLVEHMSLPLLPSRIAASVFGGFGLLALALAAMGIYGVMSYAVSTRTHEVGVRTALGAQASDVLTLVIRQGITLTLMGLTIGLSAAFALTRLIKVLLFGVSATDPLTFAGVTVLLAATALLACYIPARRAARVNPIIALRCE